MTVEAIPARRGLIELCARSTQTFNALLPHDLLPTTWYSPAGTKLATTYPISEERAPMPYSFTPCQAPVTPLSAQGECAALLAAPPILSLYSDVSLYAQGYQSIWVILCGQESSDNGNVHHDNCACSIPYAPDKRSSEPCMHAQTLLWKLWSRRWRLVYPRMSKRPRSTPTRSLWHSR